MMLLLLKNDFWLEEIPALDRRLASLEYSKISIVRQGHKADPVLQRQRLWVFDTPVGLRGLHAPASELFTYCMKKRVELPRVLQLG